MFKCHLVSQHDISWSKDSLFQAGVLRDHGVAKQARERAENSRGDWDWGEGRSFSRPFPLCQHSQYFSFAPHHLNNWKLAQRILIEMLYSGLCSPGAESKFSIVCLETTGHFKNITLLQNAK